MRLEHARSAGRFGLAARGPTVTSELRSEERASRPGPPPPGERTILLVNDDRAVRESLQRLLTLDGWSVATADGGGSALDQLRKSLPALLITDLCMTEVNGWDLLFHLRLEHPQLPIFVVTALPAAVSAGADTHATEFFQKPLDLDALLAAVRRQLGPRP